MQHNSLLEEGLMSKKEKETRVDFSIMTIDGYEGVPVDVVVQVFVE